MRFSVRLNTNPKLLLCKGLQFRCAGPGAIPGTYKVTVDDRQPDAGAMKTEADAQAKKAGVQYSMIPQEIQVRAMKAAKGSLPGKYQIASTSDLEVEVKAQSNKINLELKD